MQTGEKSYGFLMLESLPHGAEFRFIDEVTSLEKGKSATAKYRVRSGEELDLMKGHFPQNPILPGVVLIEMIAQLGGVLAASGEEDPEVAQVEGQSKRQNTSQKEEQSGVKQLRLAAVRQAKIHRAELPEEVLEIQVELVLRSGLLVQVKGQVTNSSAELVAEAQVVLVAVE